MSTIITKIDKARTPLYKNKTMTTNKNIPFPVSTNFSSDLKSCLRKVERLSTCIKIANLINSELSIGKLLSSVMETTKKTFVADAVSLLLIDDKSGDLTFQIALGEVGDEIKEIFRLKKGQGIAGTVAITGIPLNLEDVYQHPKFSPENDKKTKYRTRAMLCVPLKVSGKIIGVIQVINKLTKPFVFSHEELEMLVTISSSVAVAIDTAKMHKIILQRETLERDLKLAREVQESFLPKELPMVETYRFAALNQPALEIGGDFYNFFKLPEDKLGIVLGDVSGKGVPAALQMARLMSDFRYISQVDPAPEKVLTQINNTLCERSYRGMFTTAVFCLLDMKNRKLSVANGGHLSLLLKRENSIQEIGSASGTPLGVLPNMQYSQEEYSLQSGDEILIFTDGVTEPKNKQQEEFGLDRLKNMFADHAGSPEEFLQNLENSIKLFIGDAPQFDDLTSLTFKAL